MRLLIQQWSDRSQSFETFNFVGPILRVGSATDQDIQIKYANLPQQCLEFRLEDQALKLRVVGKAKVFINNAPIQAKTLSLGDLIHAGGCQIALVEGPEGYDAALEVRTESVTSAIATGQKKVRQTLEQGKFHKRLLSWIGVVSVLMGGLIVPFLSGFNHEVKEIVEQYPLVPSDIVWSTGPLHNAHRLLGDDCGACHQAAFEAVPDSSCLSCHAQTAHHVNVLEFPASQLEQRRCATCHIEHNEPSFLVVEDDGGCVACHRENIGKKGEPPKLLSVKNFELDHPEFRVSVPRLDAAGDWRIDRVALTHKDLKSSSNLKFPHDVHLNETGVEGRQGLTVLDCVDCHQSEVGGKRMLPVTMESHCADCHQLEFDPEFPERQLPHGSPALLLPILEEFYAKRTLIGRDLEAGRSTFPAERPGEASRLEASLRSEALVVARRHALVMAEEIFERTTCATCHQVQRDNDPTGEPVWSVKSIKINETWMPKAIFDHEAHRSETCESCHAATQSNLADDILLPAIDSCRSCHASQPREAHLVSPCLDCHQFHSEKNGLMRSNALLETSPAKIDEHESEHVGFVHRSLVADFLGQIESS